MSRQRTAPGMSLRFTAALVVLCAGLLVAGAILPGPRMPHGEVVFARSTGRSIDLYTLTLPDGTPVARTEGPGTSTSPAFDPTGRWIVYARRVTEPYHLWLLDTDTGEQRALTRGEGIDGHPSFAPDGAQLVFASNRQPGAGFHLHVLTLADGREQVLTPGRAPAWSPDARHIAFERDGVLWVHDLADGRQRALTSASVTGGEHRTPAWSPDGTRLVFSRQTEAGADLMVLDLDDGALTHLTQSPGADGAPSWSPDGAWVVFSRAADDATDLYAVHVGSGRVRQLTDHERHDVAPAWRPGS